MENKKETHKRRPRRRASTVEVLGAAHDGQVPAKWASHQAELLRLRDFLTGQRHDRTADGQAELATSGEHIADAASDSYERDWALAMASSDQTMLYEVNQALNRLTNGTYGFCELSGQRIEPARLKALPWTRFCAAAQAELESRGAAARTHLGKLGSYQDLGVEAEAELEEAEEPEKQAA